jgi:CHAT domain-containing protein
VLSLVVLSSCSGGTSGLAAALVAQGADRVLAMHTTITEGYATLLGRHFYQALIEPTTTVATALAAARHDIDQQHRQSLKPARTGRGPRRAS